MGDINVRGKRLVEGAASMIISLRIHGSRITHAESWTWVSPGDCSRNQIDFIIAWKRFRNEILFSKSTPGADCGSDHVPVVCVMRMKLKKF
ncbi:craniofacial development protein 2-like [Elysia marginata]|uniref:Craniofacial development protein 2-like n=1 Tax=Elysia marginata TaxID=1093978 RepID=A0AAV4G8Z6_9GAST|nr:craniofacial development protein 2-like [Elysia marginata]